MSFFIPSSQPLGGIKNSSKDEFFFYTLKPTASRGIKDTTFVVSFFTPKPTQPLFFLKNTLDEIKNFLIFGLTNRPYRLVAQDSGFSFPQQRFETAWGDKELI